MAEYIERANAAEYFEKSRQIMWHKDDVAATISSKVDLPTSDVVEVVRCKDCEYLLFDTEHCKLHNRGYCKFDDTIKQPNHFCSYGKRKEGAEE